MNAPLRVEFNLPDEPIVEDFVRFANTQSPHQVGVELSGLGGIVVFNCASSTKNKLLHDYRNLTGIDLIDKNASGFIKYHFPVKVITCEHAMTLQRFQRNKILEPNLLRAVKALARAREWKSHEQIHALTYFYRKYITTTGRQAIGVVLIPDQTELASDAPSMFNNNLVWEYPNEKVKRFL